MMHKIRCAMGNRDNQYLLNGDIEVDEGFFETLVPEAEKQETRKRGRGSQKQTMAMVFAQPEQVLLPKKHKPSKRCKYFKMIICDNLKVDTARKTIKENIDSDARIITDGYSTYKALTKEFTMHVQKVPAKQAHIKLPWVHTAIGNAKKVLQGIYQHTKPEYLQNYLDEFCYKINRRYFHNNIFDRILIACTLI
jgi:transposase-like protein